LYQFCTIFLTRPSFCLPCFSRRYGNDFRSGLSQAIHRFGYSAGNGVGVAHGGHYDTVAKHARYVNDIAAGLSEPGGECVAKIMEPQAFDPGVLADAREAMLDIGSAPFDRASRRRPVSSAVTTIGRKCSFRSTQAANRRLSSSSVGYRSTLLFSAKTLTLPPFFGWSMRSYSPCNSSFSRPVAHVTSLYSATS
jgi:hypothetical protein